MREGGEHFIINESKSEGAAGSRPERKGGRGDTAEFAYALVGCSG